jgi:tRNA/tmRNA/rRNA uracil-C5-methylase (TrmA/RlmC/RlmD family)
MEETKIKKPRLTKAEREELKIKAEILAKKQQLKDEKKLAKEQENFDSLNQEYISDNPWIYKGKIFTSDDINPKAYGFIYMIREKSSGRIYIGQKHIWTNKVKTINKKKKKVKVESDWKQYYSSSAYINEKFQENGSADFERYILVICISSGQMNYVELKLQIDLRMLEQPEKYINGFVGGKIHASHIKFDQILDADKDMLNSLYQSTYYGFSK